MKKKIKLNRAEIESGLNRVVSAEQLILKLPPESEGRNSWLLNFGVGDEAKALRDFQRVLFDRKTNSAHLAGETFPVSLRGTINVEKELKKTTSLEKENIESFMEDKVDPEIPEYDEPYNPAQEKTRYMKKLKAREERKAQRKLHKIKKADKTKPTVDHSSFDGEPELMDWMELKFDQGQRQFLITLNEDANLAEVSIPTKSIVLDTANDDNSEKDWAGMHSDSGDGEEGEQEGRLLLSAFQPSVHDQIATLTATYDVLQKYNKHPESETILAKILELTSKL